MLEEEKDAALDIARRTGIPYASFENRILTMDTDGELAKAIPEKIARARRVLPLFRDGKVLAVAMVDPSETLLKELETIAGSPIQPFITTKTQLARALDESYPQ